MEEPPITSSPSSPSHGRAARRRRRVLGWLFPVAIAVAAGSLTGIAVAAAIHMPRVESLSDFTPSLITQVHDATGEVFASFARERRVLLQEGAVPRLVQEAVVAAEDSNFFDHGGIDAEGVARAALRNLTEGRKAQGASTITMQLARLLYLNPKKTWQRKIEETLLAVDLEKRFSKEQILTLYCNLVNFGHGNYGVEVASRAYFGKPAEDLTLNEAATLAGIIQRPSAYSPYRRPDLVVRRRDYVLRRMLEDGYIDRREYQAAIALPLQVSPRQEQTQEAPYFTEEVRQHLEATHGTQAVHEGGLQVWTTLDRRIQAAAEDALAAGLLRLDHRKGWRGPLYEIEAGDLATEQLPSWDVDVDPSSGDWHQGIVVAVDDRAATVRIGEETYELAGRGIAWTGRDSPRRLLAPGMVAWFRFETPAKGEPYLVLEQEPELEGAVVVLESGTGAVRAMVGGWDFERSKFNRATQAERQVGSAFKPFVYGAALESGYTPADTLFDAPASFLGADGRLSYQPQNYYRKYYGIITLRRALELSVNVTSVKLLSLVGVERVIDFARRCGIRSHLPPYPSVALGSADLTPIEMATAFSAFANQGIRLDPYYVERVADRSGRLLEEHQIQAHTAIDPEIAYVLTHMLEGVVDRGTAASIAGLPVDLAGKTGTTDDYSDAWFVGYTPKLTLLAWVGYDTKRPIGHKMTGSAAALPIWRSIAARGLEEGWIEKGARFAVPPRVVLQPVEYYSGLLPGPGSGRVIQEAFVEGTQPVQGYDARWSSVLALPWYQQGSFYLPKQGERMP